MLALAEQPRYFSRTHCLCNDRALFLFTIYSNIYEFVTSEDLQQAAKPLSKQAALLHCRQRKLEEMREMREMGKKIPQILTFFYTPIPLE